VYWIVGLVVTLILFQLTQIVYVITQAALGLRFGATVESISVGWGPTIWKRNWRGINFVLRLMPINAYTQFASDNDDCDEDEGKRSIDRSDGSAIRRAFIDLPLARRMLIVISGPLTTLAIGAVCASIPVWIAAPQVVVDPQLPKAWPISGVPGLTVSTDASTYAGQIHLFQQTFLEFFRSALTRKLSKGWGGYFGWVSTCSSAGLHTIPAWFSCFGVVMVGIGILNLLPIPPLNGGQLVFLSIEGMFGRPSQNVLTTITLVGMPIWLFVFLLIFFADLNWFFLSFLPGE
jgi:regulator of sigma E protease